MADAATGSPPPPSPSAAAHNPPRGKSPAGQAKRTLRPRKPQIDGSVSDSLTNPTTASPRSQKPARQRQGVPFNPAPIQNGNGNGESRSGSTNASSTKARPMSIALAGAGGSNKNNSHTLPSTPAKEQAYAGPTFQASPAPSSLPVPRFFSRSVPNNASAPSSLQERLQGDMTPEEKPPSPAPDVVAPVPARGATHSPLDMLFSADMAEKQSKSRSRGMLSPEFAARLPGALPATEPRNPFQQQHLGKALFLRELDGADADMPSPRTVPATAPPRPVFPTERSHFSPSNGVREPSLVPLTDAEQSYQHQRGLQDQQQRERDAMTQSLKAVLFRNASLPVPPQEYPRSHSASLGPRPAQMQYTPSPPSLPPLQRSASGPCTPAPQTPASAEEQRRRDTNYALHYGNRNLSPLFKAVRDETPAPSLARPSGLRQQFGGDDDGAAATATVAVSDGQTPSKPPPCDSTALMIENLNRHVASTQNSYAGPRPEQANGGAAVSSWPSSGAGAGAGAGAGTSAAGAASPRTSVGSGPQRDVRSMEEDLRRMLKLHVVK